MADGNPVRPHGINKIGLERNEFSREEAAHVEKAYKIFFRSHLTAQEALARLDAELGDSPAVRKFAEFIRKSQRGVCR
jgi:UDP-N-acetylglucosamine acyltransferase